MVDLVYIGTVLFIPGTRETGSAFVLCDPTPSLQRLTQIRVWTSNRICCLTLDVITHPCPKPNGGLTTPPFKLDEVR